MKIGTYLTLFGLTLFFGTEAYKIIANGETSAQTGFGILHYAGLGLIVLGWLKLLAKENSGLIARISKV